MTHRFGRGRGRRTGSSETPEDRVLARLATITNAVWFDPAYSPNVVTQDDSGTLRIISILSRDVGWTQYTISNGTLAASPAAFTSPNGKQIMSFAGAHYLNGAAGLAALLQGAASYSDVHLAGRTVSGSTQYRWCAALNLATPDNRVEHLSNSANNDVRQRTAAGASTQHVGSAWSATTVHTASTTYDGSAYNSWIDGVASIVAGANTRAPLVLDDVVVGARRAGGALGAFWNGPQAGLVITPGTALSDADRAALQTDLPAYYGY